jgi:hypothetical protein
MTSRLKIAALLAALILMAAACGDGTTTAEAGQSTDSDSEQQSDSADQDPADDDQDGDGNDSADDDSAGNDSTDDDSTDNESADDGDQSESADDDSTDPDETDGGGLSVPAGPEVTLLDAGSEPRIEMRIAVPDGTSEVMVMEQEQSIGQELAGETLQDLTISSIIRQQIDVTVADGGFELAATVLSAEAGPNADPATAELLTGQLQSMVGVVTRTRIDEFGNLVSSQVENVDALDPASQQLMESGAQLSVPLPTEPVGVGAVWTVVQPLEISGALTTQTSRYTVESIDGSVVTLAVATDQVVEPGAIIREQGLEIEVLSWTNTGTGTLVLDLTKATPTSNVDTFAVQELAIPGSTDPLVQTIEVAVAISSE